MFLSLNWPAVRASEILGSMLVKFCAILSAQLLASTWMMDDVRSLIGLCMNAPGVIWKWVSVISALRFANRWTARVSLWLSANEFGYRWGNGLGCAASASSLLPPAALLCGGPLGGGAKRGGLGGVTSWICANKKIRKRKKEKTKKRDKWKAKEKRIRCGPQRSKKNWTGPV